MTKEEYLAVTKKFAPMKTEHDFVRIGPDSDGGYLVPDDLEGIKVCFSPGVCFNAGFEADIKERYGINSHQADYSVETPPEGFEPLSFTKKYLGAYNNEKFMTLESWVREHDDGKDDLLLQMDIENGEYATLIATPDEILKRFRIIVLEVHGLDKWAIPVMHITADAMISKLQENFVVVHTHPNNFGGLHNLDGLIVPDTVEITLLRKDRCTVEGPVKDLPHPLDRPCAPHGQDFVLPDSVRL